MLLLKQNLLLMFLVMSLLYYNTKRNPIPFDPFRCRIWLLSLVKFHPFRHSLSISYNYWLVMSWMWHYAYVYCTHSARLSYRLLGKSVFITNLAFYYRTNHISALFTTNKTSKPSVESSHIMAICDCLNHLWHPTQSINT